MRSTGARAAAAWVIRACGCALLVIVVRVLLGFAQGRWPQHGSSLRLLGYVLVVLCVFAWGLYDGRRDRIRSPDPAEGADLSMRWLAAAAAAAFASAVACWLLGMAPRLDTGSNSLSFELTAGAAFITLTVFAAGQLGIAAGRIAGSRRAAQAS